MINTNWLGNDFCKDLTKECLELTSKSVSLTLVGLPGVGISFFLRHLSESNAKAKFIHINTYELTEISKINFLALILSKTGDNDSRDNSNILEGIKSSITKLLDQNERIVLVFNRFDYLEPIYSQNFFDNLRSIRDVDREKIVMIFASTEPIYEIAPNFLKDCYSLFSVIKFLKPYRQKDLSKIMKLDKSELLLDEPTRRKAMRLSGGHHSLLQNLIRCQSIDNPLGDPMVNLMIKEIYSSLSYKRQKILEAIVAGKSPDLDDRYLLDIGLINRNVDGDHLFTSLMQNFIAKNSRVKLPSKERRLFALLKKNVGKVVLKDEIIEYVWGMKWEDTSDWALNSLVYRLRRNKTFQDFGYTIESHKSDGYSLKKI